MPLLPGKSKQAFQHNVRTEIQHGKDPKTAVAIAYSKKGEHKAMGGEMHDSCYEEGGEVDGEMDADHEAVMDHCAMECMDAIEKKDKEAFKESLSALVAGLMMKMAHHDEEEEEM